MSDAPPLILHVDDDDDDAFAIADAFARSPIPVTLHRAADGQQAIDYLQNASAMGGTKSLPRLVLLDLNMPVLTGHQFLQWRSQNAFKRVPVLVLSSSASAADVALAMQSGANGYIVKPSSRADMDALVRDLTAFWLRWIR